MKTLLAILLLSAGIAHAETKQPQPKPTHYVQYVYVNGVVVPMVVPILPEQLTPEQKRQAKEFKARFLEQKEPAWTYMRERGLFETK